MKSYTGDKPYKGLLSGNSFIYVKYIWSSHTTTHAGDKLYRCPLSENSYACTVTEYMYLWSHKRRDSGRHAGKPL